MTLQSTANLISEFAILIGLPPVAETKVGYELSLSDDLRVMMFDLEDVAVLIVILLGKFPDEPSPALASYLLRKNMIGSTIAPFHVGLDEAGSVLMWTESPLRDITSASLVTVIDAAVNNALEIQGALKMASKSA